MICVIYRKSLQAEIESLQQKIQKAFKDINEEKSLRICAESRIQGLETELQDHKDDVAVLQSQIDDYRNFGDERMRQVSVGSYSGLYTYGDDYLYTSSYVTELVNVRVSVCR
jgi:chromosome segregation ATPase